jgi:hypothetical protein
VTPRDLAAALTVGAISGMFPIPGATSLVCVALCWLLRTNLVVAQVVNLVITPIEIAAIPGLVCDAICPSFPLPLCLSHAAFSSLGAALLRVDASLSVASLTAGLSKSVWATIVEFQAALGCAIFAWFVASLVLAPLLFVGLKPIVSRMLPDPAKLKPPAVDPLHRL